VVYLNQPLTWHNMHTRTIIECHVLVISKGRNLCFTWNRNGKFLLYIEFKFDFLLLINSFLMSGKLNTVRPHLVI
jgi:hypothetical protein